MVFKPLSTVAPRRSRRRAFSLLEMLIVIAALQVFLALIAGTMWAMVRIERSAAADFQRALTQGALADQFRADVAAAATAPGKLDGVAAGPQCLILRNADEKKIIYRWDGEHLQRAAISAAGTTRQRLPLGVDEAAVEFARDGAGRLLTLRLTETHGQGSTRRQHLVEIRAALGGDRQ
jgi:Tfp pilus assembly protein FimT